MNIMSEIGIRRVGDIVEMVYRSINGEEYSSYVLGWDYFVRERCGGDIGLFEEYFGREEMRVRERGEYVIIEGSDKDFLYCLPRKWDTYICGRIRKLEEMVERRLRRLEEDLRIYTMDRECLTGRRSFRREIGKVFVT